jgi:hypothetical protein
MSKVTVYRFTIYDVANDESRKSRRWATRAAIEWAHGHVLEETAIEVDASALGGEVAGMTERDFNPHKRSGFQTQVTS